MDELREIGAKILYEYNEDLLVHDGITFEKCKEIYPEKVDIYYEQIDKILKAYRGSLKVLWQKSVS